MNFWDTSAFLSSLDALSPACARAAGFLRQNTLHSASTLILPETVASLTRRLKPDGVAIDAARGKAADLLSRFNLAPVGDAVIESSQEIARKYGLRGADSVHLATAVLVAREGGRKGLVFLTRDGEQATAARRCGLRVVVP